MNKTIREFLKLTLLIIPALLSSQNYTWMKGHDTINKRGVYGLIGVTSTSANPGGRSDAAHWKDNAGNFWLLGGDGYDRLGNPGLLSDLWKYQISNNTWTWMKGDDTFLQGGHYGTLGVANPTVWPGGRSGASTWKDNAGNLWLFGGFGYASTSTQGYLADLWKYDVNTNQWTWVNGNNVINQYGYYGFIGTPAPTNVPGSREGAVTWIDANNNLWLYGGFGYDISNFGHLNDLWKYNIATNEWTWMAGSNTNNSNGNYGAINVPAPTNVPGARAWSSAWVDQNGLFWLFGGEGYDMNSAFLGLLNDMWTYNTANNEWTWVKGSSQANQNGIYGSQGISAAGNTPGARKKAISWIDAANNMWISAGEAYPITGVAGRVQDLWKYNTTNGEWTWMKGGGVTNISGIYGTQGTASPANVLGSRSGACRWIDNNNNLWLFGGNGRATLTYTANGALNDLWRYNNCFVTPETLTITAKDSLTCAGETTSLTVTGGSNYSWNTGSVTPYVVINPTITTSYTATSTNTNNCVYRAVFTQSVDACTHINSVDQLSQLVLYPNPSNGRFKIVSTEIVEGEIEIRNNLGQLLIIQKINGTEIDLNYSLPLGVYLYRINQINKKQETGKLIIRD